MKLLDIVSPQAVKVPLEATEKRAAIEELVDLLAEAGGIDDAATLKEIVWDREQQRTTGIGEGLAIPHGRSNCSKTLLIAIGRPTTPIDFDAVDRKPVQLIVLLVSPPDKTADHIQALGKISRMMSMPEARHEAYAAETAESLYEVIKRFDS
ncbi:MAG: PTS sugar transporter subunit IIA [Planctomycetota bacterium]|jgi:fructose-specific phosphotransferase system IIA component